MSLFKKLDIKVVVISFLFAATFWFFRAMNNLYDYTVKYDIVVDYDNTEWIQTNEGGKKVPINVSGKGWFLLGQAFGFYPNTIYLKLNELPSKKYALAPSVYPVLKNKIRDVRINYIAQDTIKFNVEPLKTKKVPFTVSNTIIDKNHKLGKNIIFSPKTIEITGARSVIDTIKSIELNSTLINPDDSLPQTINTIELLPDSIKSSTNEVQVTGEIIKILYSNFAIVSQVIIGKDTSSYQFTINSTFESSLTEDSVNKILENSFFVKKEEEILIPSFKKLPESILKTEVSPSQIILKNAPKAP